MREAVHRAGAALGVDLRHPHDLVIAPVGQIQLVDLATGRRFGNELTVVECHGPEHMRRLIRTGEGWFGDCPEAAQERDEHEARPPHTSRARGKPVDRSAERRGGPSCRHGTGILEVTTRLSRAGNTPNP